MVREDATPEKRVSYRTALDQALRAGYEILKNGGEAMDAAVVAVSALEGMSRSFCECSVLNKRLSPDCPLFNAGKGAVFNIAGKVCRVNYHYLLHTIVHLPSRMSWRYQLCYPSPPRPTQLSLQPVEDSLLPSSRPLATRPNLSVACISLQTSFPMQCCRAKQQKPLARRSWEYLPLIHLTFGPKQGGKSIVGDLACLRSLIHFQIMTPLLMSKASQKRRK